MKRHRKLIHTIGCAVLSGWVALATQAAPQPAEQPGDASALHGRRLFLRCASCHNIGASEIQRIGPNLQGVVGRKAGSLPGFAYSPALRSAPFIWDETMLDRWLQRPSAVVPGTAMVFGGLPKAEDRKAVISYLKTAGSTQPAQTTGH